MKYKCTKYGYLRQPLSLFWGIESNEFFIYSISTSRVSKSPLPEQPAAKEDSVLILGREKGSPRCVNEKRSIGLDYHITCQAIRSGYRYV